MSWPQMEVYEAEASSFLLKASVTSLSHRRKGPIAQSLSPTTRGWSPTPPPGIANLQSHAFSQTYSAILPTSLTYIVLSTRGCSPWRPDAVMSTARRSLSFPSREKIWVATVFKECPRHLTVTKIATACQRKIPFSS